MPSVRLATNCVIWYQARGSLDQAGYNELRVCYAVSCDGVHWEKPELGLMDFNGSKKNNTVEMLGGRSVVCSAKVIYDPYGETISRDDRNWESR